jgi:hypothetical protein
MRGHVQTQGFSSLEIYNQFKFCRGLNGEIAWLGFKSPGLGCPCFLRRRIGAALAARHHFLWVFAPPAAPHEAENGVLRQQVIVLRRQVRGRIPLSSGDRLFFVQLYRWFLSILKIITVVRPETLVRWHRAGFRRYWRWKFSLPWEAGHGSAQSCGH